MPSSFTRYANRWVRALVFPDPAPAMTRTGPSVAVTASRCARFRPAKSSDISPPPFLSIISQGPDGFK